MTIAQMDQRMIQELTKTLIGEYVLPKMLLNSRKIK